MRTKTNNDFEKDFYKLMNNSVFGKTMENIGNIQNVRLSTTWKQAEKLINEHTTKATLEWRRNKKIKVLEWPSQSLNRNPIENLWYCLKIAVHQHSPHNLTELEQICLEEWANISQ